MNPNPSHETYIRLAAASCMDVRSLEKLTAISLDVARRGIPGDIVECGVYNGGSAGALVLPMEDDRDLWLYDTFDGLPVPHPTKDSPDAECYTGQCKGSAAAAINVVGSTGFGGVIHIREGLFADTFLEVENAPKRIALLHIDADWYEGTLQTLNRFYHYVTPGGVIILDDFGHWGSCRRAFYEFCQANDFGPLLERYGHTVAWWQKGKQNNRDARGKWEMP